jgi:hypothetical protein
MPFVRVDRAVGSRYVRGLVLMAIVLHAQGSLQQAGPQWVSPAPNEDALLPAGYTRGPGFRS